MSGTFQRLETLFHEVLAATGEERERILAGVAAREPDVYPQLVALLAQAGSTEEPLAGLPAVDPGNTTFGPYRVVRPIGAGGMGLVYEAEQSEPIRRRVALKVVPVGRRTERVLARFELERRALARMSHPAIATVFDAGQASDGRPFFAMEYVDGQPITAYCDARQLDLTARLRLFLDVCGAVQHAHQKGILHRDLKPSNVLVADGDPPRVKVIDFGIARSIEPGPEEPLTHTGEPIGTPAYMSPEQAAGDTGDIDVRTDVYALGVLLYELLTGRVPFTATPDAGQDPTRPSARYATDDAETTLAARRRKASARTLRADLRGDLDWITLTALMPDRERRYPSVAALNDDLARTLRHEPITARPPSAVYRFGRFARRHRLALALGTAVWLALVGGVIGTSLGLQEARRAQREAEQQAEISRQVADFMVEVFGGAMPTASGADVSALQLIEQALPRVHTELADQPLVQERLLRAIGEVLLQLGQSERGRDELEDAVALARSLGADGEEELARALLLLGRAHRHLEALDAATAAYEESVALHERVFGPDDVRTGLALNDFALLFRVTDPERSLALLERAYAIRSADPRTANDMDTIMMLGNIGSAHLRARRHGPAAEKLAEALARAEGVAAPDDPRLASLRANSGFAELGLQHYERAEVLMLADIEGSRRTLPADHPSLGISMLNLGQLYLRMGRFDEARRALGEAEAILAKLPPSHSQRIIAARVRGTLVSATGERAEARRLLEGAITAAGDLPESATAKANAEMVLVALERAEGHPDRALRWLDELTTHGPSDPLTRATIRWERSFTLGAAGQREEAEAERQRARDEPGNAAVTEGVRLLNEARFAAWSGDDAGAVKLLRDALAAGYRDAAPATDPAFARVRARPDFPSLADLLHPVP